ncbi:hypothetical protein WN51_01611 [Melipona quadrifasciata]|uniref:Uncharacterized protein n=1 Tax=Melipona quadrifasciata TaxID=166423 RepID=A0A0N0BE45_9HYME|nr:hypothetical protein WN51_01611 [Melipona quadrifasciata]
MRQRTRAYFMRNQTVGSYFTNSVQAILTTSFGHVQAFQRTIIQSSKYGLSRSFDEINKFCNSDIVMDCIDVIPKILWHKLRKIIRAAVDPVRPRAFAITNCYKGWLVRNLSHMIDTKVLWPKVQIGKDLHNKRHDVVDIIKELDTNATWN